jgi:transposase
MLILGCDYHPSVQQVALVDMESGECQERRLAHRTEAEHFYRELKQPGVSVRVGMEATGHSRWFERLLAELGFEVWIGDPARIRAKQVRKQKNDLMDAAHLLNLMMKDDFPRICHPIGNHRHTRGTRP